MASSCYSDEKAESAGGKKINLDSRGTSFSRLACGQDLCPRRGWTILPARFGPSGREKVCRSGGARGVHGIAFSSRLAGANSGVPTLQLLENLRISVLSLAGGTFEPETVSLGVQRATDDAILRLR